MTATDTVEIELAGATRAHITINKGVELRRNMND
jgi:hypothetical protein